MSRAHSPRNGVGLLDLRFLCVDNDPNDTVTRETKCMDVASHILDESLDTAQHVIGHSPSVRNEVFALATMHSQIAAMVYAAYLNADALHEVARKIAGAIREAGADVEAEAALAEVFQPQFSSPRNRGSQEQDPV